MVVVAEGLLRLIAEGVCDFVGLGHTCNLGHAVVDDDAVLDVLAADLGQPARVGAVSRDELRHDGDLLRAVDLLAGAIEGLVAHAEAVEVASVLVTDALVAVVAVAAIDTRATCGRRDRAHVGGVSCRDGVGFPDVHFRAARSVFAGASVDIVLAGGPAFAVGLEGS